MMAMKRLLVEYKELSLRPPAGVAAGPAGDETNMLEWECVFLGPEGTPYDGGCFHSTLSFPKDYPLNPPVMRFTQPLWHPNVYPDGKVCISILHEPVEDKFGYEQSCERWSPVQSIEKIILSVISMLAEPNDESPANIDAAKMWRTDREAFDAKADECVRKSLGWA
ncbi:Ubiquitin-conjugating enzyme E2 G2 [Hondaea fermentalgiana]|uniref:E2 ubiquitin-conjugating enzyme n=1 Tax=Hondaea fermentalgiana TaxID=2315210 RepID=A0A2R5GTV4_9STRA|nr:Ubiquitin-conjugating enzyme E2 G2 [Hondaea fermentalgiana]|eukprot:GBG34280.1 Ubiquitin-conjugating enzyme E2 G2 [Hondaea fermentalgiana]